MDHATHAPQHSTVKQYLIVFTALGLLTGLTVSLSYMHLSHHVGIALAALISAAKCTLIATFFMHLKSENRGITFTILTAIFFVSVLVAAMIPDIGMIQK